MPKHPVLPAEPLSVGEAAALVGVHVDTIKRWEKAGRIASSRPPSGHRRYAKADVEKLLTAAEVSA
jgi:excisionase family DNA binding protein